MSQQVRKTPKKAKVTAHVLSSLHAYMLIIMGVWAFFDNGSKAHFILVIVGVPILTMNNGVRYSDKSSTRVALFFTVLATAVAAADTVSRVSGAPTLTLAKSILLLIMGAVSTVWLLGALRRVAKVG